MHNVLQNASLAQKSERPLNLEGSHAFSCVIDREPRFVFQAARLLLSLRWFGGRLSDAPFFLSSTGELPPETEVFFFRHGARIHYCQPFDETQPHITSNKLRGLELGELRRYQNIILVDSDVLIVQDPMDYMCMDGVGLKIADVPTVKDELLRLAFRRLGVEAPVRQFEYEMVPEQTFGYFNSGVVVVSNAWAETLADKWSANCRQLLTIGPTMGIPKHFIEQSALAATVAETGIPLTILPSSMNFPVHFSPDHYPVWYHDLDPQIIHYHWLSNDDGFIKRLPLRVANLRVEAFNARLRAEMAPKTSPPNGSSSRIGRHDGPRKKVIVGSGWWCDEKPHGWAIGADQTRTTAFFSLWLRQVERCLKPDRIVITDSNSPLKPDWQKHPKIQWVELDMNYGGANDIRVGRIMTKFSGFTRSVINGAMYALCCDADYYVYVEQDCLIRGKDFLAHATGGSSSDIFLGQRTHGGKGIEGRPAAPMIQQSCIIVTKAGLERFIAKTMEAPETDGELSPEVKMDRDLKPYEFLRIPFGRSRPLDFSIRHLYVQHLEEEELTYFLATERIHEDILQPGEPTIFKV